MSEPIHPVTHCPECMEEIDDSVCWCGDEIKDHHYPSADHPPVPMGCRCGFADGDQPRPAARVRRKKA